MYNAQHNITPKDTPPVLFFKFWNSFFNRFFDLKIVVEPVYAGLGIYI